MFNQSLNGLLQRVGWTSTAVWAALAMAVLVVGLRRAREAHLAGDELAAISLVALAGVLVSPISWVHHAVWIVPVTGVLLGDGRARGRWIAWGATMLVFLADVPLWGRAGVPLGGFVRVLAENAFVLVSVALLVLLPIDAPDDERVVAARPRSGPRARVRAAVPDPSGRLVAVIRHGSIDDLTVEGIARADTGEALRRSSLCYVGSLAKQFVAACASSLVADGAIDPDAPVSTYVEDLPAWANTVRVRHLVHHTAGIPDRDRGGPPPPPRGVRAIGNDDVMADIRALEATAFPPGSRYAYSNRGYQLLGQAVSAAARRSLADTAADRLFGPLGMTATFFRDRETPLPPEAARGHFVANDGRDLRGAGAVPRGRRGRVVDDGRRPRAWDAASYDASSIASRLARRGALDDGTPIHYGWGLSIRTHRGLPIHSHGGSFPGWASKMVRFPTERTTVLVLANGETGDVSADAFELADRVLADADRSRRAARRRDVRRRALSGGLEAHRRRPATTTPRGEAPPIAGFPLSGPSGRHGVAAGGVSVP